MRVSCIAGSCTAALSTAVEETGESKYWKFKIYVDKHVKLYSTACDLEQHGYHVLDVATQVSRTKTEKLYHARIKFGLVKI
jgi:hypothetical protein